MKALRAASEPATREILRHWQEAVPNDRLAHLVKHAARSFARALQMRLAEHSVSYGHWSFLRILWESEGLTQRQLSGQAGVMEPTTFSALNAMERLGYVVRKPSPTSRKEVHVYLTRKGRALKNKLVPLAEEVNEVALRDVGSCGHRRDAPDAACVHREPGRRRDGIAHVAPAHPLDARTLAAAQRSGRRRIRKSVAAPASARRQVSVNPP